MKNIIIILLILVTQLFSQSHENKTAKYLAGICGLGVGFTEGADQAWFFTGEHSKWKPYNKGTTHVWWGVRRVSMVGTGLLLANWHPKQKLVSYKTVNQFVSYSLLYSWAMNRGLRLVQTGKMFPSEYGHSYFIDLGFFRFDVQCKGWMQWTLLGVGTVGLVVDAIFD